MTKRMDHISHWLGHQDTLAQLGRPKHQKRQQEDTQREGHHTRHQNVHSLAHHEDVAGQKVVGVVAAASNVEVVEDEDLIVVVAETVEDAEEYNNSATHHHQPTRHKIQERHPATLLHHQPLIQRTQTHTECQTHRQHSRCHKDTLLHRIWVCHFHLHRKDGHLLRLDSHKLEPLQRVRI